MPRLLIALLLLPFPALAEPPRVATDIPPVHALVAIVMEGVGAPTVLVPPGASPHDYAMRPSQARALSQADVVFWIGPTLTPSLARAVDALGGGARIIGLLDAEETRKLRFGTAGHDHDDQAHGRGSDVDPHAWLDPANARAWLALIAVTLAEADPENAGIYRANSKQAIAGLAATENTINRLIEPARNRAFMFYHDAFRYFQVAFSVEPLAVIADGDAVRPGAARLARVRDLLQANPGACVFLEPQIPARAVDAVIGGTGARVAVLDPLGALADPGPGFYHRVLSGIAQTMHDCLVR